MLQPELDHDDMQIILLAPAFQHKGLRADVMRSK